MERAGKPDPLLTEAYERYKKQFAGYVAVVILVPVVVISSLSLWAIHIDFETAWAGVTVSVPVLVIFLSFMVHSLTKRAGFKKRLVAYQWIIELDLSAKITGIHKTFAQEYVTYETDGKNSPERMRVEFFQGGRMAKPGLTVYTDHNSPFDISMYSFPGKQVFETDDKNLLLQRDQVYHLGFRDYVITRRGMLEGECHDIMGDLHSPHLSSLLWIMLEIQEISSKGGRPIRRSEAEEDFDYWESVGRATVCFTCVSVIGRWKNKDKVDIPRCPECGADTYMVLAGSKKKALEKIRAIRGH